MAPLRLLVCGDVDGKFSQLFSRVDKLNKKNGPFDMLLCVGNFFCPSSSEWEKYRTGKAEVPIPTYILGPNSEEAITLYPDAKGCELCTNITFLGKQGILTDPSGLRICFLSGIEGTSSKSHTFSQDDVISLENSIKDTRGVDVLLTSSWPWNVWEYAGKPTGLDMESAGSKLISHLAHTLQPRYHFSGLHDVFYERLPYRNHVVLSEPARNITRFIALAKVGNPEKKRWLYAFSITPCKNMSRDELVQQTSDVTENPYSAQLHNLITKKQEGAMQFFYDMNASSDQKKRKKKKGDSERKKQQTGPCWFCLSSPEVEKQLIISVGEQMYLALAKGGLNSSHLLILPVNHVQSSLELSDDAIEELEKFKFAISRCFEAEGKSAVLFERNYRTQHMQIQVLAVPHNRVNGVADAFKKIADSSEVNLQELPSRAELSQIVSPGSPFFYVELPSGDRLYTRIRGPFPLNFGREVLASPLVLNVPDKADWRTCQVSQETEAVMAKNFRERFEAYDFTMDF